ncbi:MAG: DedA family protein [Calditrichaeota bacterium]|nr:VTT domain-containing protein [Calditrichota bacterium]RQW07564.1 MAG: DedA family protein [Calditrichota bacterium]
MFARLPARWKFVILSLMAAALTGMIVYRYAPAYTGLTLLFFYIIPSNSFIPFPHEPAIIYYGKIFGPMVTTLTAAIPTVIACIIDYAVLTPVFSRTRLSRLKTTRIFQKTVSYFHKAPFLTNFMAALSPVPFYPVRVLSVASEYPLWKYIGSVMLGRIPRYYFLALFGAVLNIPNWIILLFFVSLILFPVYRRIGRKHRQDDLLGSDEIILEEIMNPDDGEEETDAATEKIRH